MGFFFVTYIIIYSAIERDLYELYPSVLYGFDIIFIPQVWFVKICRFFLFTQNLISLFSPQCLVRYLTFLCVSVSICIFEPVYNLRNTKYIKSLYYTFMNWGKRNLHKSNANDRIVHIVYTVQILKIYGSSLVNHVKLFFCSSSFLSQKKNLIPLQ